MENMRSSLRDIQLSYFLPACLISLGYILISASFSQSLGYTLLGLTLILIALRRDSKERWYFLWLWIGVFILSLVVVDTAVNFHNFVVMTSGLIASVVIPYVLAHRKYKHSFVHMGLDFRRRWTRKEIGFVVFAVTMTAFWQPFYFLTTNAHSHWHFDNWFNVLVSFVVIMIIGLWEEFFFIALVLTIYKQYLPFWVANVLQASMFASFLYQMGFTGWIVPLVMVYALYQGYVFHVTRSLFVTITIHVLVDLIVFLSLLYSSHPGFLFG